jgi:hypothetical protein
MMNAVKILVLISLALLFAPGCATLVTPPATFDDPVTVYFADYGVHSALILPEESKHRYVEYVFGDYAFCVMGRNDPLSAMGALLVSSRSAIGRREHFLPPPVPPAPDPPPRKMVALPADRAKVKALLHKLDKRYRASPGPISHNDWNNVDYTPDAEHYSLFNSCNHLTLRNLHELGYQTNGFPILPNFEFEKR